MSTLAQEVEEVVALRPHPGPQEDFLASPADVALYGGAAGGGKTWSLLVDPLRWTHLPGFRAVTFRRTYPEVANPGGLWDESQQIYPAAGGAPRQGDMSWTWPSGAVVRFAQMQHETDRFRWQGSQLPFIGFDQVEHFTRRQFFYMLSRCRSLCGVRPYVRATCNPDPDSWLLELVDWWLDAKGDPLPERSGRLRWFGREGDRIVWADDPGPLRARLLEPLSFTFIAARLEDNPTLVQADPSYRAKLLALPSWERAALLGGNWRTRPEAGTVFNRRWFSVVPAAPAGGRDVRYWDRAATEPNPQNLDPDWTVGVRMRSLRDGRTCVVDVVRFRAGPRGVRDGIRRTAEQDGTDVEVVVEEDPGQAGKAEAQDCVARLAGFNARAVRPSGDKLKRAEPFSAQAEAGNVSLVRAAWNEEYLTELHGFPEGNHDDQVDASSGAYNHLAGSARPRLGFY